MTFRVSSTDSMILFNVSVEQSKDLIDLCRKFGATALSATHFEFREHSILRQFQLEAKNFGLL